MGTVAYIKQVVKLPHDLLRVLVEGRERAALLSFVQEEPYLKVEITQFEEDDSQYADAVKEAMYRSIRNLFQEYCMESGKIEQRAGGSDFEYRKSERADYADFS